MNTAALRWNLALILSLLLGAGAAALRVEGLAQGESEFRLPSGEARISPAHTYGNLSVYLIHGRSWHRGRVPLTLQEALEQGRARIHETGEVSRLEIENLSAEEDIFVHSGDILKGGKQDRVLTTDLLVPPRSGRVPIAAFCVEQGRWRPRGSEAADRFSSSEELLATRRLKLAAKHVSRQDEVWREVSAAQAGLSAGLGERVAAEASPSSYQLSLESRALRDATGDYIGALSGILEGKRDVLGFAFAINGELNSADIYASEALFRKLWPRLLKASVVEAIGSGNSRGAAPPSPDRVRRLLGSAGAGKASERAVDGRIVVVTRESGHVILFETLDRRLDNAPLHLNYILR